MINRVVKRKRTHHTHCAKARKEGNAMTTTLTIEEMENMGKEAEAIAGAILNLKTVIGTIQIHTYVAATFKCDGTSRYVLKAYTFCNTDMNTIELKAYMPFGATSEDLKQNQKKMHDKVVRMVNILVEG
jgi:hypothetical protein